MRVGRTIRGTWIGAALVLAPSALLAALTATPASAARHPVYRDPPTYAGFVRPIATKPAPLPPQVPLAATGLFPDVLVDEAGTAHIVWTDPRGDDADAEVYCQLPRGATRCARTATLTWDKSYGAGDGPQFNTDDLGPRIVRIGDQLVILDKRFPTGAAKPDGASGSDTVLAWTSTDGGQTWSSPVIVGTRNLGGVVEFGPPDDPTILNVGYDPFCSTPGPAGMCVEAYRSGQYTSGDGNLSTARDANYNASVALDGGLPVAAFEDLGNTTYVRRWTGTGSVTDASTWTPPTVLQADEPFLAGGPAGLYLLSKLAFHGPYGVRRLDSQPAGYTPGAVTRLSGTDAQFGRLAQDPSGHLLAAWERHATASQSGGVVLQRSTSTGGRPAFGPAQRVATGEQNGQIALAATDDGGGFAVFNHTGGVNSPGQIVATGFGNQGPTGRTGIAGVPGAGLPSGSSCEKVRFGSFTADSAAGCFLHGTGAKASLVTTGGEVDINGLRIIPDAGAKIILDPIRLTIDTIGQAKVVVSSPIAGDVTLWHGEIHRDLSRVGFGSELFRFEVGTFAANVFGFRVGADVPVRLERDGVHIPLDLKLPPEFGGFQGHAELVADRTSGLKLSSLHVHIGSVPLGVLVINHIDVDYQAAGDVWNGSGSASVPAGGTLDLQVSFAGGAFQGASFNYTLAPPAALGPFVYLVRVGGGLRLRPAVQIDASARFGAPTPPVNGTSPINLDGTFRMTFPPNGPADFRADGQMSVLMFALSDSHLDFQTDGYASFRGHVGADFDVLSVDGSMDGYVDATTGHWGAGIKGDVKLCIDFGLTGGLIPCFSPGADVGVSDAGFAACGHAAGESGGVEIPWRDFNDPAILFSPILLAGFVAEHVAIPCSTSGYHNPPPRAVRAQSGGGLAVNVPGGLPTETILVRGSGGAPQVTVTGPGGATVQSGARSAAGFVAYARGLDTAYVVLRRPRAGTWTIAPKDGSPAIAGVMQSEGYTPATVSARLDARRRLISYRIAHLGSGQRVVFAERGRFGTHLLGTARSASGTLRFRPAVARGGRRTVLAYVQHGGITTSTSTVGRYVAPGIPRPARVRGLRVRRRGRDVVVTWRAAAGAHRYAVRLRGSAGTVLAALVGARTRRVVFGRVRRDERVTVSVQGLSRLVLGGPVSRAGARGQRLPRPGRPRR